jgi:N-methylhydantoinase A
VGQGYELRVALPEGRIDEDNVGQVWERMHDLHRSEYGHAFPDNPIELVNLRVSGVGRTPKITEVPVGGDRGLEQARLKEREVRFRVGESLESVPTVFYERDLLPVGEKIEGPAVVVQGDTTTVLPPGTSGALDEEGNLILELREA